MEKSYTTRAFFFLLIVVIIAMIAGQAGFSAVRFTANNPGEIGTQLLTLMFIALVIERAVEVFISNQFGGEDLEVRRPIRLAQAKVDVLDEAVVERAKKPAPQGPLEGKTLMLDTLEDAKKELQDARNELVQVRYDAQPALEALYVKKRAAASMMAVVLGLLVAASGVRVFADLVLTGSQTLQTLIENDTQRNIFLTGDILITALLLAGGADGIHQVLKRFVLIEKDVKG